MFSIIKANFFCLLYVTSATAAAECKVRLTKEEQELVVTSSAYIKEKSLPELPSVDTIEKEMAAAENSGVISCIAIRFFIGNTLNVETPKILNDEFNNNLARNSIRALRKYVFKENAKNKEAIVVVEFLLDVKTK